MRHSQDLARPLRGWLPVAALAPLTLGRGAATSIWFGVVGPFLINLLYDQKPNQSKSISLHNVRAERRVPAPVTGPPAPRLTASRLHCELLMGPWSLRPRGCSGEAARNSPRPRPRLWASPETCWHWWGDRTGHTVDTAPWRNTLQTSWGPGGHSTGSCCQSTLQGHHCGAGLGIKLWVGSAEGRRTRAGQP